MAYCCSSSTTLSLPSFSSLTHSNHAYHYHHQHHAHLVLCSLTITTRRRRRTTSLIAIRAHSTTNIVDDTLQALQWPQLCAQLSAFVSTPMATAAAIPLASTLSHARRLLRQTAAAALLPRPLDFARIHDLSAVLASAAAGDFLTVADLCLVHTTLAAAHGLFRQLDDLCFIDDDAKTRYLPLLDILGGSDFLKELAAKIGFCLDCNLSIVLDRASESLAVLRSERKRNLEELESLLKETSNMVFRAGAIDNTLVTKRRSRMCVGIKASHRSLLPGCVILDVSSSGATYFVEPKEAIDLNNLDVKLSDLERAEERAVLSLLASEVAASQKEIGYLMEKVLELDLASARGLHSRWINGVCPILGSSDEDEFSNGELPPVVDINKIRHPLLLEASLRNDSSDSVFEKSAQNQFPVPLDIKIQHGKKVVIISGPNTGGKTASMKTLGLAVLMSKAGLFLPCTGRPKLPWFDQVLADIGDHQSLEHSLSTFSGHILRLRDIMALATPESLVLIDEIGSGTDPSEGLALSTSILKYIVDRVNLAVVTTHYADLSCLKLKDHRFENAAMEFSLESLQPTYRILWGSTGCSNALNIAELIGLDLRVLNRAHEWVEMLMPDKQEERQGVLYQSLLKEKHILEDQAKRAIELYSEAKKLYDELSYEAENLDERETSLKAKESFKVRQELQSAKLQIDSVIKKFESRVSNISYDQINALLKESEAAFYSIVGNHRVMFAERTADNSVYIPRVGDKVYVKGFGNKLATVLGASGNNSAAEVQFGKIKMIVKKDDMRPMTISEKDRGSQSVTQIKAPVSKLLLD